MYAREVRSPHYAGDPMRVSAAYYQEVAIEPLPAMVKRALATD